MMMIERHGEIRIQATRIMDLAAEQAGMQLSVEDLLWERLSAKNATHVGSDAGHDRARAGVVHHAGQL